MKKLLKVMIAMAMVLCLSVTAFAAASTSLAGEVIDATDEDGNTVEVTVEAPSATLDATDAVDAIEASLPTGSEEVDPSNLSVVYLQDLSSDKLPVTITFTVGGAGANDTVYVLHYDGSAWEVVGEGKGSTVSATFTSLSPVALVLQKAPTTTTTPSVGSSAPTSPETGESMTVLYAGVVMVLAGAVAFTAWKKKENA